MTVRIGPAGPPIRANAMEPEVLRQAIQAVSPIQGVVGSNDLIVTQHAGTPAMNVDVAAGQCLIDGTESVYQGFYSPFNDGVVTLAIQAADTTNTRWDLVVMSNPDAYYSGASNTPLLQVITGTPGPSPSDPPLLGNALNSLRLARVVVPNAPHLAILNADIINLRVGCSSLAAARGLVAQTSGTANVTGVTAEGNLVTPLAVTTVTNRKYRVTAYLNWTIGTVGGDVLATRLKDQTAGGLGSRLAESEGQVPAGSGISSVGTLTAYFNTGVGGVAAGTRTYSITGLRVSGTGNGTWAAASDSPMTLTVEDVGSTV